MHKTWRRTLLKAYQPLRQRGLLIESQQRLPPRDDQRPPARRWVLLALLLPWRRQ